MLARAFALLAIALSAAALIPAGVAGGIGPMRAVSLLQTASPAVTEDDTSDETEAERRSSDVRILSSADHDIFSRAFDAADRGDWNQALALASTGRNPIAKQLVEWRYLRDRNAKAPFAQIDAFLRDHPDWPSRNTLFTRAEEALDPATPPAQVIAWFGNRNPQSAIGMIRLGEALAASNRTAQGAKLIREGWAASSFDPAVELGIVQKDGAYLTPDAEKKRLDTLIWADQVTAARRQMARVDDASQAIAAARLALRADSKRGWRAVQMLSSELARDPALLFDEARAHRKNGDFDSAAEILLRPAVRELARIKPGPVWAENHIIAREMLKDGKNERAYRLVSDLGLTSGAEFSDSEFLAGWIALRVLKDGQAALPHFQKLSDGVSRPISRSRGYYWQGRAYEAINDTAKAYKAYAVAAAYPETFYGQLALTRIDPDPKLHLTSARANTVPPLAAFERDDLVKAMRVLADLGTQSFLRVFALRYLELHPSPGYSQQLLQALARMGYRDVAVRVAKAIGYEGPSFPAYAYPVIAVPEFRGPGQAPEPALVHAIIRQETEFDPQAVSRANARGLMQLTLAAAKTNARRAGLPYRPNALTTDTTYNMQLGMTELSSYLGNWGNSVVVSAAAYNAGETNAKRWIATFGDPRSPGTDPIDWIESITYGETRNYVMRIVENLQVYRSRLAGRDAPLRILSDLYAPGTPPLQPVLTPPPEPPKVLDPPPAKKPKPRRSHSN